MRLELGFKGCIRNLGLSVTAVKVKSESEVTQSCLTLCDPMDCSLPGSYVHGIFQARILEWIVISSPGDFPKPVIEPKSCIAEGFFTT